MRKSERSEGKVRRRAGRNAKEWKTKGNRPKRGKWRGIQEKIEESIGIEKNREE